MMMMTINNKQGTDLSTKFEASQKQSNVPDLRYNRILVPHDGTENSDKGPKSCHLFVKFLEQK
jgi:hypothetical protein